MIPRVSFNTTAGKTILAVDKDCARIIMTFTDGTYARATVEYGYDNNIEFYEESIEHGGEARDFGIESVEEFEAAEQKNKEHRERMEYLSDIQTLERLKKKYGIP